MDGRGTWIRELAILLAGLFFAFVNVTMLIPVLPVLGERAGGTTGAGALIALFFVPTAGMQVFTPVLMQRWPARRSLTLSMAALGAPCFVAAAVPDNFALLAGTTVIRGAGFGVATVVAGTLVAEIAPPERRGTAVGWSGLVFGIPPVFAPAAGLALVHRAGAGWALSVAGAVACAGAAAALGLGHHAPVYRARPAELLRALVEPILLWPLVWFGLASVTRGAVISYVPITLVGGGLASAAAFLLISGTFGYLSRWWCGRVADRTDPRRLILPGSAAGITGLVLLAASQGAAAVATSAALIGAGYGAQMTASQLDMLARGERTGFSVPIAAWNIAIDCGFGLGGVVLGALIAAFGYEAAFWVLPGLMLGAYLIAVAEQHGEKRGPRAQYG